MKILVVFGSKSDEKIFGPLKSGLEENHEVRFEILSAHRNPVELDHLLGSTSFDMIMAGAGLAAHLPGVVASKVNTPVLGIPVNSVLGGLDSLLSIQQMPFGVPVLSSGPDRIDEIISFAKNYKELPKPEKVNLLLKENRNQVDYKKELDRTISLLEEKNIPYELSGGYKDSCFNIMLVTGKDDIQNKYGIHVPLLTSDEKADPKTSLNLLDWLNTGGMWVGTNNTRNAVLFFEKLYNLGE